jgi:hypothetical protein
LETIDIQPQNDFLAPPLLDSGCNSLERPPFCGHPDAPDVDDSNYEYPDVVVPTPFDSGIDDQPVISARLLKRQGWNSPTVSELPTWSNTWDSVTSSVSNAVSSAKSWWYGDSGSSATVSAPVAIIEPDMPSLPASTKSGLWSKVTDWCNGNSAAIATSSTPALDVLSSIPSEPAKNNGFLSRLGNWWNDQTVSTPEVAVPGLSMPDIPVPNFDTPGNPIEICIPEIIIPDGWMENSFSEIALPEILPPEIPPPAILPPTIPPPGLPVGDFSPAVDPIAEELLNWRNTYNPDLWESVPNEAAENYLDDNTAMPQVLVDLQNTYDADVQESVTDEVEEYYLDNNVAIPKEFSDWSNSYNPDLWESGPTDISQQVAADPNLIGETRPVPSGPISDFLNTVPSSLQSGFSPSSDTYLEIPSKPASNTFGSPPVIKAPQDGLVEELVDWSNFYDPHLWESGPMDVSQQVASDPNPMPIVEAPQDKGKGREVSMDDSADLENVVQLQAIRVPKDGMRVPPGSFAPYDSHGNLHDFAGPSRIPDVPHNSLAGLRSYLLDTEDAEGLRAGPVSVPEDKGPVEYVYEGERIQDIEGYRDSFAGLQILRGPWDGLRAPQNSISDNIGLGLPGQYIFVEGPESMEPTDSLPIPDELIDWRDFYDRDWPESPPVESSYDFEVPAEASPVELSTILQQPTVNVPTILEEPGASQPVSDVSHDSGFVLDRNMIFEEPERMDPSDFSSIPEELLNWRDFYDPDCRKSMPAGPRTDFEGPAENVLLGVPTISEPPLDFPPVLEEPQSSQPGNDVSQDGLFMLDRNILLGEPERMDSTDFSPIPEELSNWRDPHNPALWAPEPLNWEDILHIDPAPIPQELRDWQDNFDPDLWGSESMMPSADFEEAAVTPPTELPTISQDPGVSVGSVEVPTLLEESVATTPEPVLENQMDLDRIYSSPIPQELPDLEPTVPVVEVLVKPLSSIPMTKELAHNKIGNSHGNIPIDLYRSETSAPGTHVNTQNRKCNPMRQGLTGYEVDGDCFDENVLIPQELDDWRDNLDPKLWSPESFPST